MPVLFQHPGISGSSGSLTISHKEFRNEVHVPVSSPPHRFWWSSREIKPFVELWRENTELIIAQEICLGVVSPTHGHTFHAHSPRLNTSSSEPASGCSLSSSLSLEHTNTSSELLQKEAGSVILLIQALGIYEPDGLFNMAFLSPIYNLAEEF